MQRVLIFSHEFPPNGGGAGVVAYQLCEEFIGRGYKVSLLSNAARENHEINGVNVIQTRTYNNAWFLSYVCKIDINDYDIIILNDPAAVYVAGLTFDKRLLEKSICFLHGSEPELIFESPSLLKKLSLFSMFYERALSKCKFIACPSKYMKSKFLQRTGLEILKRKIEVVYFGVEESKFYYDASSSIRKDLNIENCFVFLTVARLEEKKGFSNKLKIFKRLTEIYDDLVWVIVGSGSYQSEILKFATENGIEDRVILVGKVQREFLKFYYSSANVFWLLSDYDESFGLVYVEAQLCGLPCIGYRNAGVKESVCDEQFGVLIDSPNEIIEGFENIKELNSGIDFLRKYALNFTVSNCVTRIMEIFSDKPRVTSN